MSERGFAGSPRVAGVSPPDERLAQFASDNFAGVHPAVLDALAAANQGWAPAYGADVWTAALEWRVCELLGDAEVLPVLTGTGGNLTALAAVLRPFEAVICAATAHVNVDECGALERFAGCKLIGLATPDGKLTPQLIAGAASGLGDQHKVQVRVVSISQSTELGTVYTPAELTELAEAAHESGLLVHVDGARLTNAAVSLGIGLREATAECGVDLLTLGGAKAGLLAAEAVVILRPELAGPSPFVRKQAAQLAAKMRYVSAQLLCLFGGELWRETAGHANAMALRLASGIRTIPGVRLAYPVEANAVFAALPRRALERLARTYAFYVWDEASGVVRWMCSWQTTAADVDGLIASVREAVAEGG